MFEATIIDRGRGPEIAGTRVTVFDVLDYLEEGWPPKEIARLFHLSASQLDVAAYYIEVHRDEVMKEYRRILERCARGNPPELQARLNAGHERFLAMVKELRTAKSQGAEDAGDSAGR